MHFFYVAEPLACTPKSPSPRSATFFIQNTSVASFWGGGEFTKGDSGEKPESVSRVSEKTLTNLIGEFQKKKFS